MHGDYGSQIRGRGVVGVAEDGFFEQCYEVVRQVPAGRVTTYGQVAALLGNPRRARFVGFVVSEIFGDEADELQDKDAHVGRRVREHLAAVPSLGVVLPDGRVDMDRHLWEVL